MSGKVKDDDVTKLAIYFSSYTPGSKIFSCSNK